MSEMSDERPAGRTRPRRARILRRVEAAAGRAGAALRQGAQAAVGDLAGEARGSAGTPGPLVPPHSVARRSLLALVAIMSFLACLGVAGVATISDRARDWRSQIADEVTIQIRPQE